jgi:hypothetical protein
MKDKGLTPAGSAAPRVLLRRLCFDLIGLPPSAEEVEAFERACGNSPTVPEALWKKTVDQLLASPHFGERWGRHWLDLVRYAESRGHEFDYTAPNAYQYRDYVIRALNADVPYDRFVVEHIAGDLLPKPRLDPKTGANESIVGTGFWFLGEQVHSPVDTGQDKADRFDNMIDVFSKTFLGLTVACARCHDHKFDAISTKDYYSLFGFLESSSYRLAPFDTMEQQRRLAERLDEARRRARERIVYVWAEDILRQGGASEGQGGGLRDHPFDARNAGEIVVDYGACPPHHWLPDGVGFGLRPVRPGEVVLGDDPAHPIVRFAEVAAAERDLVWDRVKPGPGAESDPGKLGSGFRFNRTLSTPTFTVTDGPVHYLVRGSGIVFANVDGHVMINGPLHGQTIRTFKTGGQWQWLSHDLTRYRGRRAHLEFSGIDGAELGIARVVQSPTVPTATIEPPAAPHGRELVEALGALVAGKASGHAARIGNWLLQRPSAAPKTARLAKVAAEELEAVHAIEREIQTQIQLAPAMLDNVGVDEAVYIRGNCKAPGPVVPRHFLEALAGPQPVTKGSGSGRLELARQVVDPERDPFIARVVVNRLWHHLFGRGIVASVDNFGVLGERPSHPELLDFLADEFVKDGWSVKRAIQRLVMTDAYRRASLASAEAQQRDANNVYLSHQNLRRLEGEAIRDAMLAVSGRLDRTMFGPSVPVHLTDFQQGRGRPASGPLDGNCRRSIYLAVRRNFLSPFLLAFDTPIPFSTVGRRTVSNVPAQALILLNDPFVHQQAAAWAKRALDQPADQRLRTMYLAAYGRPPSDDESAACREYLHAPGREEAAAWTGLAHVLLNAKDFLFVE